jgi:hypothetical protein
MLAISNNLMFLIERSWTHPYSRHVRGGASDREYATINKQNN